jgi:ADP-heptose:LPS heptosyltransferase
MKVSLPEKRMSRFQKNFELLRGLGLEVKNFHPKLHIPPQDKEYVESVLHPLLLLLKRPFIAIHPGTSQKTLYKRWMPIRYAQLADRLIRELKATVIFTWGPEELEWVEGIRKGMEESSVLAPKTKSLTQLGEVYRHCDLYIGGDTGPMHIASLIGKPVVAIYGPTDPLMNEPFGKHKMVRKELGCSPCRNRSCKEITCLKMISVDDVFKATEEILSITTSSPDSLPKGKG